MTDKKKKILLVDDDKFLLNMYSLKFKNSGLDVDIALNSEEALSKIKDNVPDIFLIDIVMPGMDGLELVGEIKKQHLADNSIVVILSNNGDSADIEKAKNLGVDGYIVKATTIPSEVIDEVMKIWKSKKS